MKTDWFKRGGGGMKWEKEIGKKTCFNLFELAEIYSSFDHLIFLLSASPGKACKLAVVKYSNEYIEKCLH